MVLFPCNVIALAFSALLRNTLKNTEKTCKASHMRKLKTLPEICLLSVFIMLGTKTINNKELTLCGNSKENYRKRVFSAFYVEKR